PGAVSLVCGSARELLDHVREEDIISFTGSADTAARVRSHTSVLRRSVRVNIEADSINSAILGPDCAPASDLFDLLVKEVLKKVQSECSVVFGGNDHFAPVDADPQKSAFVQPTLLSSNDGLRSQYVHDVEVFGPVMTLIAYLSPKDLIPMVRRGRGSLVASVFSNDPAFLQEVALGIGDLHGRIVAVDSTVGGQHTGHGNVVHSCLHGGPGRAGGGEELAGLRAVLLYHRRFVVQGPVHYLKDLSNSSIDA